MIRELEFAKRVTACRQKLNLGQTICAQMVGVSRQQMNNWEMGICKPKGERMDRLAVVLQCDITWLQHGERSEIEQRLENVMMLMRVVVRDLNHIHKALGQPAPDVSRETQTLSPQQTAAWTGEPSVG
jgi:transcriptional regulator with XRE-family HTH domain